MFQYAFALYVSKKLGVPFCLEYKKSDGGLRLLSFALPMPHRLLVVNRITRLVYRKIYWNKQFSSTIIESIEDLWHPSTEITPKDGIAYKGYFQHSFFTEEVLKDVKKAFSIKKKLRNEFSRKFSAFKNTNYAIVHFRFKDYEQQKLKSGTDEKSWSLPYEWYLRQIEAHVPPDLTLLVISDDMEKSKAVGITHKKIVYPEGSAIEHFQLLLQANILIISNSTYAWWGGMLNIKNDKKVIAPFNFLGYNLGLEFPKGIMTECFLWEH